LTPPLLLAVLLFLYFWGLADVGLLGPDEPRYAAIGRQMARSGDWVTPVLWSKPWYEKPALLYWMSGLGNLVGLGPERAPRYPVALASVAFLIFFYRILLRAFENSPVALYASVILAVSAGWLAFSFVSVTDVPLSASLGVAVLLTVFGGAPVWVAGIFLGLAVLAKGLVPWVLFAPIAAWLIFWKREWKHAAILIGASILVAAPWYLLCYLRNGWPFIEEFFVRHHFQRFSTDVLRHVQPWYFYLPVLLGAAFPWTPLYGVLLSPSRAKSIFEDQRVRVIGLWVLWCLVFFSSSKNKLPGYILPAMPGIAILLGLAAEKSPRWVLALSAWLLSLIPALAHVLGPALDRGLTKVAIPGPPAWGLVLAGIAALCTLGNRKFAILAIAGAFLIPLTYLKQVAFPILDRTVSARQAAKKGVPECVDHSQRDLYYGLNYYLDVKQKLPVCGDVQTPP
jgi:4-amino-4-deoxy-L-arabinose transferase-like glycosyltransferase